MKKYKVLFADLDGTLIETATGKTFAEDVSDFRIRLDVLEKIKKMEGLRYLHIVTNQGGIPKHYTEKDFSAKFVGILHFIQKYFNKGMDEDPGEDDIFVSGEYCASMDKQNPRRKPNTGMLESFVDMVCGNIFPVDEIKPEMLMIGDASGKEGQHSDSDKKCAENFGIDYMDIDDFMASL